MSMQSKRLEIPDAGDQDYKLLAFLSRGRKSWRMICTEKAMCEGWARRYACRYVNMEVLRGICDTGGRMGRSAVQKHLRA
jgi:hypothetical protein